MGDHRGSIDNIRNHASVNLNYCVLVMMGCLMVNVVTVEINGIGPVLFERSKRAKHVNISVKPFRGVRVAVPYAVSFNKAEEFVHSNTDWIRTHLEKMQQYEREYHFTPAVNETKDKTRAKSMITGRLN